MAQLGPFILAVTTLVLAYLYTRLRYHRYKQLAGFPQLRPVSLLWGDLKNIHEYLQQGPPQGHVDLAFTKMREKLGNPSLFTIDTWPMQYSMAIICDHDVAEQVSKVSKTFHWSVPKSPTFSNLLPLIGYQSILINEVNMRPDYCTRQTEIELCMLISITRESTGRHFGGDSTPGSHPSTS